ncbi:Sec-independent protein translocase protein TatB [Hoeflea alexandrii]|uniref:Sec-independent protein translocase protein TatB n=1 Tax=Hoeflea alexandrii TaxID=288436 RepID=UPI002270D770|nr:Sec-independent protein translocase protein TatB [Hoeflea alexandrii]MCY0153583.1 Sec-independent protein translocase protein TatB [Hoeflea alexandrii]
MLDIGWPELLVVAIVLIVVVGPKDLPPMLRAFGRTTKKLRGMASEFRGQFDEALREAELDDVKKTFDDARKLNPMQGIRDAVNPLKDTAKDIKADLEKSVNSPSSAEKEPPKMTAPEPSMKLSDGPPEFKAEAPAKTAGSSAKSDAGQAAAKTKSDTKKVAAAKPAKAASATKAKPAAAKPAGTKSAAAKSTAKPAATKAAASKPASKTAASGIKAKSSAKPATTKTAPRASKPKQGEDKA